MRSSILLGAYIIARAIDVVYTSDIFWAVMIALIAFALWDIIEFMLTHLEIRKQGKVEY